jgi:hypothetical protein
VNRLICCTTLTEGERWTRRQLKELRTARFRPRAVAAFLAASHRRAGEIRRARPDLAAQAHAWTAVGAVVWTGAAVAGIRPFRRRAAAGLAWWAAVGIMLDWHLGMVETEDGQPRRLGPADALTLARAWLVPVLATDLQPTAVLAAAATDAFDGPIARATAPTRAGRDLEGLVDSAVYAAALISAHRHRRLSPPVVDLELARLAAGFGYAVARYFARLDAPDLAVVHAARATTAIRVAGLVAAGRGHRRIGDALVAAGSVLATSETWRRAVGRRSVGGSA